MTRIIPAIDIIGGKCVRLTKGDYAQMKTYNENPLEVAKEFEGNGIQYLHLVDLDGAKSKEVMNWKILEEISNHTSLKVDFGGGIKSDKDAQLAFDCGASQINVGSAAVKNKPLFLDWLSKYGSDKIILGADVKDELIAISGWQESTDLNLFDFLKDYRAEGVKYLVCTDISKDGLLQGSSIELYQKIAATFPDLKQVASGGVTDIQEVEKLVGIGVDGIIIGKAIYENRISLEDLKQYVD